MTDIPAPVTADQWRDRIEIWAGLNTEDALDLVATVEQLQAELRRFKPEPMSQFCRDGEHGGRCYGCRCLCHTPPREGEVA